ncbi:MAG: phosphoenolpyruvate--protein phosphotransferase, partial [Burkholderiaceae bacterium]|nr:phosphoenolpyruvate--protein phosphotransferase [Burkholderiaceae bacterium]
KPLDAREAGEAQRHTPNPALGLRAIRYSLAQPAMFLTQLRALLRAAAEVPGSLRILVPMLAHDSEIRQTYAHLTE